jgi:hypothetical protein
MKWITRSHVHVDRVDSKRLLAATACGFPTTANTCGTSLKFMTRCMHGADWMWRASTANRLQWI